jgi:hypothetical protein
MISEMLGICDRCCSEVRLRFDACSDLLETVCQCTVLRVNDLLRGRFGPRTETVIHRQRFRRSQREQLRALARRLPVAVLDPSTGSTLRQLWADVEARFAIYARRQRDGSEDAIVLQVPSSLLPGWMPEGEPHVVFPDYRAAAKALGLPWLERADQ